MIRAVAFDLWETLLTDTPEAARQQERARLVAIERILAQRGFGATAERIETAYRQLWNHCYDLYWSRDVDIPTRRQIAHFLENLGLPVESFSEEAVAEIEHAYAIATFDIPPAIVSGAAAILALLRDRGLAIGLISNTGRTPGWVLRRVLAQNGLAPLIDAMVFSNEHGECKPRPSIFEKLRAALGLPYEEIVFVGDNLYVDVYGAQQCGMRGIHFVPPARGTAVARPVEPVEPIVPDATVSDLMQIAAFVERFADTTTARSAITLRVQ